MKIFWNAVGFALLGLGIFGVIMPGIPGTVFLILSLSCFVNARNERLEKWMLNHKWFGETLRDWREEQSIPLWVKVVAVSCIIVFSAGSMFSITNWWARGLIISLAVYGVIFILTRKTKNSKKIHAVKA